MRIGRWLFGSVVVLTALGSAASLAQTPDSVPKMNMRWAHFVPSTWGSAQAEQLFAKEIENRTGGNVTTRDVDRGVMPFIFLELIALALLLMIPQITLFLPNVMI